MGIAHRLRSALAGDDSGSRCAADWRRPDGYWRCDRPVGHRGRHKMRAAQREQASVGLRELNRSARADRRAAEGEDGGLVAG